MSVNQSVWFTEGEEKRVWSLGGPLTEEEKPECIKLLEKQAEDHNFHARYKLCHLDSCVNSSSKLSTPYRSNMVNKKSFLRFILQIEFFLKQMQPLNFVHLLKHM